MNTKIIGFVFFLLIFGLLFSACNKLETPSPTLIAPVDSTEEADSDQTREETYTISYNDGTRLQFGSPWGDGTDTHTPKIAVKFTPESYPARISQVELFVQNETGQDQKFNLYAYKDINGLPDEASLLFELVDQTVEQIGMSGTWLSINPPETVVSSDSFWVVVEWQTKPLKDSQGSNSFRIGQDASLDHSNRNLWQRLSNESWVDFPSISTSLGDAMINVVFEK